MLKDINFIDLTIKNMNYKYYFILIKVLSVFEYNIGN